MAFFLSPLVHVNEIDLSTTVPAVATSIGVSILRNTYRGPEMKTTFISDENEMIRTFGAPTSNVHTYRDMLSTAGFLKYGNKLYCTRVMPVDATFAGNQVVPVFGELIGDFDPFATPLTLGDLGNPNDPEMGDPDEFAEDIIVDNTSAMWVIAQSRGVWGDNIKITTITKSDYDDVTNNREGSFIYPYKSDGSLKGEFTGKEDEVVYWDVSNIDQPLVEDTDFLIIVKYKAQGEDKFSTAEVWNVSTKELSIDDQGRSKFAETVINSSSDTIRVNFNATQIEQPWTITSPVWQYLTDGDNGAIDPANGVSSATQMIALDLYNNPEEIDVNLFLDCDKPLDVKKYMIQICEDRKDCMTVLDCPYELVVKNRGNESTDLIDWRKGLNSFDVDNLNENTSYASLYGNWFEVYDRYNRKYRWIPSSGYASGIYAKTDDVADPWWAPAGLNRAIITGVRRLAWNPKLGHRDMLYKNGINPIVSFAGQGKVLWGQKTMLDKPSSFNRVNVRRLFIVLEKAISTASKYFLFEPNDGITRSQLTNMINPFLRDVKARRGVYDYKVICDETNNTPERIDRNELWCTILIKATRTAEYIVLNFVSTKTGASFDEVAGQV